MIEALKRPLGGLEQAKASPAKAFLGYDTEGAFKVSYTPNPNGLYSIYLFGAIYDPRQFMDAIEVFQAAHDGDVVIVNLQSCGGSIDATDAFLEAMHDCRGRVIVKASGGCHSAGSIILMNAEEFILSDNFTSLIHNGSMGSCGDKMSDQKAYAIFSAQFMEELMSRTYAGFLTDDEISAMLQGKDFWMGPKEWMERWAKREAILEATAPAEDAEHDED